MSRNNKNAQNLAKARDITKLHQGGGKASAKTGTTKKKNAWWQRFKSYSDFTKGHKNNKHEFLE